MDFAASETESKNIFISSRDSITVYDYDIQYFECSALFSSVLHNPRAFLADSALTHRCWILNIKLLSLLRDYLQTAETWRNQAEWEESWAGSSHSGQTASSGTVWRVWVCLSSELSSPGWSHCIAIIQVARYLYVSTITEIWKVSVWWHTEFPRNQRLEMLKVWRRTLNWSTFNI